MNPITTSPRLSATTGGLIETDAQRQARINAAVRRCTMPMADAEEAAAWDAEMARRGLPLAA